MRRERLDAVIVTQLEHVQWLAGPRLAWYFSPAAALRSDGHVTLVVPVAWNGDAAADETIVYDAQWLCTLRNDQRAASSAALLAALEREHLGRVGVEFSSCGPHITAQLQAQLVDIEPALYRLRRNKAPDELARIQKAIAATAAMYARAREIIAPGVSEIEIFSALQAAAVEECGEPLTGTGNDYAVGVPGGPPGRKKAAAGELYILDLGPAFRGYFADNCRTFAVDREPTELQQQAWEQVTSVFGMVEAFVKPGASCRELFSRAKAMLENDRGWNFFHHLGHGIGLFPHEAPHLNPHWDDHFEEGDVIAVEPGLYGPGLNAGIRIENNYRVTSSGVELLSRLPLEL